MNHRATPGRRIPRRLCHSYRYCCCRTPNPEELEPKEVLEPKALPLLKPLLPMPPKLPFMLPSALPRPSEFLPVEGERVEGPEPPPSRPLRVSSISDAGAY